MQYALIRTDEGVGVITVFVPGHTPQVATSESHANFAEIVDAAVAGDDSVVDLFDLAQAVADRFKNITERLAMAHGHLYWDGDEVNGTLTNQVLRFMEEGQDFWPLVNFFENVQQNPNEHSREQLYDWLSKRDFTITEDGYIVGYKGVTSDGNGGFVSVHSGKAIVNGEVKTGRIPNPIGAVVEMPRSEVQHDPSVGCHTGLHVGTYDYAVGYSSNGALLEVWVNPRDVVSVPTDSDWAKMRVCRYEVVDTLDAPYTTAYRPTVEYDDVSDFWGDGEDSWDEDEGDLPLATDVGVYGVYRGDVFRDRDSRRNGRTLTVETVNPSDGTAYVRSDDTGLHRTISLDRLLSSKYERV